MNRIQYEDDRDAYNDHKFHRDLEMTPEERLRRLEDLHAYREEDDECTSDALPPS